jgi:putative Holliday junction resolvase
MKLLGLDVGDRRIGIAVSDDMGTIATPLEVLHRTSKAQDFQRIATVIREQHAARLVVGHPLDDDGRAGPQAQRIERFVAALTGALQAGGLDLPITFWDERFSTQRAEEIVSLAGRRPRQRSGYLDAVAAAVILQDYLDEQRPPAEPPEEDVPWTL